MSKVRWGVSLKIDKHKKKNRMIEVVSLTNIFNCRPRHRFRWKRTI